MLILGYYVHFYFKPFDWVGLSVTNAVNVDGDSPLQRFKTEIIMICHLIPLLGPEI